MPKFKTEEQAHRRHLNYNVDTDKEGKFNLRDIYLLGKNRIKFILNSIPEDSYVLEVGCNSGGLLRLCSTERKCYCKGIDISGEMVRAAQSKRINAIIGCAEKLPYFDNEFDCVIMSEILEHIYNPVLAVSEARRVLKVNGFLVGSVPHPTGYNSTKMSIKDHKWHCRIFTDKKLKQLLQPFAAVHTEDISWYNDQENKEQWIGFKCVKK